MIDFEAEKEKREADRAAEVQRTKDLALQQEADLQWAMDDPRGRRLLGGFIGTSGIRRRSFTLDAGGRLDAFNEGRRDFGIWLEELLVKVCPREWDLMMSEDRAATVRRQLTKPTPANKG